MFVCGKKKMHIKKCNIRVMTSNRMVCICVCVWLLVEFKRSIKKKFQWIRIENENRKQKLFFFLLYFCDLKLQIEKFFFFRLSLAHQTLQFIEKHFFLLQIESSSRVMTCRNVVYGWYTKWNFCFSLENSKKKKFIEHSSMALI